MINIYQLVPRVFGNCSVQMQVNGTIEANGCGKFNDINDAALASLCELGITHIWLTGIIRHATLTDYSSFGIPSSHPSLLKGRAGSPYAIADYYDLDPDLAVNVEKRMDEFCALVARIHKHGLKVLIDFVPNHLAREYQSIGKPTGIADFGENDQTALSFHPDNNFYYISNQSFVPPQRSETLYLSNELYVEQPAKVTGNDCFTAHPGINDWFETVKLNYGIDYGNMLHQHFDPTPDTWLKMREILAFWCNLGVDGFRADMAEMVPVRFWSWVIHQLKSEFQHIIMIAEIYQPNLYRDYLNAGFDYLYDKVGLYNQLEAILIRDHSVESLCHIWKSTEGFQHRMLRFMENHDEVRLASRQFLGNAAKALPAVAITALMHNAAFMIYNGQECGENAEGAVGYSGDDGRTSIYDYVHMPMHQRWMNDGKFNGERLLFGQRILRTKYKEILNARLKYPALREGQFYDLTWANPWYTDFDPRWVYSFLRYTDSSCLLVVVNFNPSEERSIRIKVPEDAQKKTTIKKHKFAASKAVNIFEPDDYVSYDPDLLHTEGLRVSLRASSYVVYELNSGAFENDRETFELEDLHSG